MGDAGGFVDPIYGEGLYFALATGLAAAEAVINVCRKKTVSLEKEFACLSSEYAKIVGRGARLQKIFYSGLVQKAFCAKVKGKNAFVGFYCDNQLARYNYSYNELFKLYADYKKNKRKKR